VALITVVGLVTITLSTYLIIYAHPIYERLASFLTKFERREPYREVTFETTEQPSGGFDVIVFGLGRFGKNISRELNPRGRRVLGVDFDPDLVNRLRDEGHAVVYGDAEDPEFTSTLPLSQAKWVVSSMPQLELNLALVQGLLRHQYTGRIATTAHSKEAAERLYKAGSDLVLLPFLIAAKEAVEQLCEPMPE
jgi:voltage-gated potassium channel Kch